MYSISGQDKFVLDMIPKGTFLEIGAGPAITTSNTYLLELNGWDGVALDISQSWKPEWDANRKTALTICDAVEFDYFKLPKYFDYISLDIEPAIQSLRSLKKVLDAGLSFGILTFEHEWYYDQSTKFESRQILSDAGYYLAKPDVEWSGGPYEDWWINPKKIDIKKAEAWQK
jgi:hypothetical protein